MHGQLHSLQRVCAPQPQYFIDNLKFFESKPCVDFAGQSCNLTYATNFLLYPAQSLLSGLNNLESVLQYWLSGIVDP